MNKIDELDWKDDEIDFWFESDERCDTKEKRNDLNRIEKINSMGLGSNTYIVEGKLRKHMKERNWKELERRGKKSKNTKYKKMDLMSGYENGNQWRIRMKINSEGDINTWIEF